MEDKHSTGTHDLASAGFRGSDLRDVLFSLDDRPGASISIRRFLRRWLVIRVSDDPCSPVEPPEFREGAFRITVMLGAIPARPDCKGSSPMLYDHHQQLAKMYSGLVWPATFLLNPEGRLVAILEGEDQAGLVQYVLRVPFKTVARWLIGHRV